ncbi:MAG TPA: maltotransferase domain-containing protein, partial [Burkholderiales bacterium]|nr:maltotransferase domain-containing protein [Burkholderiales bacterium]
MNSENKKETAAPRVVIEGVHPEVDCGRYPVKRAVGDELTVEADVFTDGHDAVFAELLHRRLGAGEWKSVPMEFLGNDHWRASFRVAELGRYEYTVRGWTDPFLTWQRDLAKRQEAGQDLAVDFLIGGALSCNPVLKDAARPAAERYATA